VTSADAQQIERGAYTLTPSVEDPRTCDTLSIGPGQSVTGDLFPSDCRVLDLRVPSNDARPADAYRLTLPDLAVVTIELASSVVDTYLSLYSAEGKLIQTDDNSAGGTNAGMILSLPPGEYLIEAKATGGQPGPYRLRVAGEAPRICSPQALAVGTTLTTTLTLADCRILDYLPLVFDPTLVKVFRLEVPRRAMVVLDMASLDFDAFLALLRPDKSVVGVDDDSAGGTNSRLVAQLEAGSYLVAATSYGLATGACAVRALLADPPSCPTDEMAIGTVADGRLATTDCRLRELLLENAGGGFARQFRLEAAAPGRLQVEAASRAFAPMVVVLDAQGTVLNPGTRTAAAASRASLAGAAGSYRVIVTTDSVGATGDFRLQATLQ
jgi:hypothetical protein